MLMALIVRKKIETPLYTYGAKVLVEQVSLADIGKFAETLTINDLSERINLYRLLFNKINAADRKRLFQNNFERFIAEIAPADIASLIIGITDISFPKQALQYEIEHTCIHCNHNFKRKINLYQFINPKQTKMNPNDKPATLIEQLHEVDELKVSLSYPSVSRILLLTKLLTDLKDQTTKEQIERLFNIWYKIQLEINRVTEDEFDYDTARATFFFLADENEDAKAFAEIAVLLLSALNYIEYENQKVFNLNPYEAAQFITESSRHKRTPITKDKEATMVDSKKQQEVNLIDLKGFIDETSLQSIADNSNGTTENSSDKEHTVMQQALNEPNELQTATESEANKLEMLAKTKYNLTDYEYQYVKLIDIVFTLLNLPTDTILNIYQKLSEIIKCCGLSMEHKIKCPNCGKQFTADYQELVFNLFPIYAAFEQITNKPNS